ncbi:hypothetical protein PG995_016224 [Apiospora arundinis]
MTPDDVAALFAKQDHESSTTEASDGTSSGRIEALGPVLSEVRGLWESGDEKLDFIVQKLGMGVAKPHGGSPLEYQGCWISSWVWRTAMD